MSEASGELRIGIVGAGAIVRERHLPELAGLDGVEIAAVSNSTYESARDVCAELLPQAVPIKNWAELVGMPELDIVWIGTPPYMHLPVTLSALEAGHHVFCQARMAMNLREAREMLSASEARPGQVAMLCPPPHGMACGTVFRAMIEEGRIGNVHHVRLRSLSDLFLDGSKPAHWRQRSELSGLNVLTLGIYAEVLQAWIAPITSLAASGRIVHRRRAGYDVEIPDQISLLCEFGNGASGTLEFSGVAACPPGDRLEVYGSEGVLVYDFSTDDILHGAAGGGLRRVDVPEGERGGWTVERDFIHAVRHPEDPRPHPRFGDGVRYMAVVQAAADAMASGKWESTGN